MTATTTTSDPHYDILDEHSLDAALVSAWVAPGHVNTFTVNPEAQELATHLTDLGKAVLDLRSAVLSAGKQKAELAAFWTAAYGLGAVAAMHYAYNDEVRGGTSDDGWHGPAKALSDAGNNLIAKTAKSQAFRDKSPEVRETDGDRCKVHVLAVDAKVRREMYAALAAIDNVLFRQEFKAAYAALAATKDANPNFVIEARTANIFLADAFELVALAAAYLEEDNTAQSIANKFGGIIDELMAQPLPQMRNDPQTKTVLDVAIPTWQRLALANEANAAGALAPWVGPDNLLLKLTLLYANRSLPKVMADPSAVARLKGQILPVLHEALGLKDQRTDKAIEELLAKAKEHAEARIPHAKARSAPKGTYSESDMWQLDMSERHAAREADKALKELKDNCLDKIEHVYDGPIANSVLAILAGLQLADAIASFKEAKERHDTLKGWKAISDTAGAALTLGSTGPAVGLRLVNQESVVFTGIRNVGGPAIPGLNAISGALQLASGIEGGKTSDEVVGSLNLISGTSMCLYYFVPTWFMLPVVGQATALLAFGISLGLAIDDAETIATERWTVGAIDLLRKKTWDWGDPPADHKPRLLGDVLGIAGELEAFSAAAEKAKFRSIPVPRGVDHEALVGCLEHYTGSRDLANKIVRVY